MRTLVPDNIFYQGKRNLVLTENLQNKIKYTKKRGTSSLTARHLLDHHWQWPTVQVTIHESLMMTWRNWALKSGKTKTSSCPSVSSLQASIHRIPCPVAVCFSFHSMSLNNLIHTSVSSSHTVSCVTIMVLSLGQGSGFSAASAS